MMNLINYENIIMDLDDTLSFSCRPISIGIAQVLTELADRNINIAIVTMQSKNEVKKNVVNILKECKITKNYEMLFFTSCCTEAFKLYVKENNFGIEDIYVYEEKVDFNNMVNEVEKVIEANILNKTIRYRNHLLSIGISKDEKDDKRKKGVKEIETLLKKDFPEYILYKKEDCKSLHILKKGFSKKKSLDYLFETLMWNKGKTIIIADDYQGMDEELICSASRNISVGNVPLKKESNILKTIFNGPQMTYSFLKEFLYYKKINEKKMYQIEFNPEDIKESVDFLFQIISKEKEKIPIICSVSSGGDKYCYFIKKKLFENNSIYINGPSINVSRDFGIDLDLDRNNLQKWCEKILQLVNIKYTKVGSWNDLYFENRELIDKKKKIDHLFNYEMYSLIDSIDNKLDDQIKLNYSEIYSIFNDIIDSDIIKEDFKTKEDYINYCRYQVYCKLLNVNGWKSKINKIYDFENRNENNFKVWIIDDSLSFGRVGFFVSLVKCILAGVNISFYVDSCPLFDYKLENNDILPNYYRRTKKRFAEDIYWMNPNVLLENVQFVNLDKYMLFICDFEKRRYKEVYKMEPFSWLNNIRFTSPNDYLGLLATIKERNYIDRIHLFEKLFSLDEIRDKCGYVDGIRADHWIKMKLAKWDKTEANVEIVELIKEYCIFKKEEQFLLKSYFKNLFLLLVRYVEKLDRKTTSNILFCIPRGLPSSLIIKELIKNE